MKKYILITFLLTTLFSCPAQTWTRKSDIGTVMEGSVSFSIGNKCYTLTGRNNSFILSEFWEWDQATDTWTRKADFPGTARYFASGFSIGTKGYIGGGFDGIQSLSDFWEWDQVTDTWTRKADFAGIPRHHATAFSIGSKGYIGTGWDDIAGTELGDFWEWDQASDTWSRKADFGGTPRQGATGFTIGTKGYIATGEDQFSSYATFPSRKDLWEWDQATDTWTQRADFGGTGRYHALGFSIGSKGYIGWGKDKNGGPDFYSDVWEWNQSTNTWTQLANPSPEKRWLASSFVIGTKAYIGFGGDTTGQMKKDFWEFDPFTATAVNETAANTGMTVSPNPTNGSFRLEIPQAYEKAELTIYNVMGEKIYSAALTRNSMQIQLNVKAGIYFLRITNKQETLSSRLVIE
jgi:N-acetylneuraminic acid mutarotase